MPATRQRPASLSRSKGSFLGLLRRSLPKNEEGATALEFALVAPALLLLTLGTIEMGLAMLSQQILESATFAASRLGKTGYTATGNFEDQAARLTAMRAILDKRAGILFDTSKISITTLAYDQFDQIGQPEPFIDTNGNGIRDEGENYTDVNHNGKYDSDMGASGMGNARQVVVYTITYPWKIMTPFIGSVMGTNGVLNLSARTVVQNEPY